MPDSIRPIDSRMVATGRAMKGAEKFIASAVLNADRDSRRMEPSGVMEPLRPVSTNA